MKLKTPLVALLALTFALGASTLQTAHAQERGRGNREGGRGNREGRGGKMGRIAAELNLTDAQKARLQPILRAARESRQALKADTTLAPEEKRARMKELRAATQGQMAAILTSAQKQQLATMRAQKREEREERRANGGGRRGRGRGAAPAGI